MEKLTETCKNLARVVRAIAVSGIKHFFIISELIDQLVRKQNKIAKIGGKLRREKA